ncbi:ABC transporter ATP-binding protein [Paenibacillus sp. GXUN7292]|uniref:ABC transporter ATP-binding protein n=1 Tax=Paenibacillus sp. GXUN7292 TaxID=3422499 RepID=UPI003D7DE0DC
MSSEFAISFHNIERKKPNFKLGPITLQIPKGYVTAIVGPNGSGKSTLFRILLGISKQDSGEVILFDEPIKPESNEAYKQRIGFLAETPWEYEDGMKGRQKAEFNQHWYSNWDINYYQQLVHQLQVNDHLQMGKMSKGMRRKLELVIAMSHHPELLLLDEPSSGLDPLAWKQMIEILHRYMDTGDRTLLMTTHIIDEVKRLADYIVFMDQGKVLGTYEKDELFSSWFTFFINGEQNIGSLLKQMPGVRKIDHAGNGYFTVTTDNAMEAEQWCNQKQIPITSKQSLELDEIMSMLLLQGQT